MTYQCLIIDDEELARELIETHLRQIDGFELVASCASAIEASRHLRHQSIDLLFLDIEMPVLKGTEFFKNIEQKPKVIFTTAYRDYALDGFELNAVDYLLKPITFARFFKAIEKFKTQQQKVIKETHLKEVSETDDFIFVSKNRKKVKVIFDDILYVESLKDYVKINLVNETHVVKYGISAFEKKLDMRFIRIHRSYIVNRTKVTSYTKSDIEIGSIEIPIGENYKTNISKLK